MWSGRHDDVRGKEAAASKKRNLRLIAADAVGWEAVRRQRRGLRLLTANHQIGRAHV